MNDKRIWRIMVLACITFLYVQAGVVRSADNLDIESERTNAATEPDLRARDSHSALTAMLAGAERSGFAHILGTKRSHRPVAILSVRSDETPELKLASEWIEPEL